jgi:hypothetical protein
LWEGAPAGTILKYSNDCVLVKREGGRAEILKPSGEFLSIDSVMAYDYELIIMPGRSNGFPGVLPEIIPSQR